jgi:AraC-like DNA-binding protein
MGDQYLLQGWMPERLPDTASVWASEVGRVIGGGSARFRWQRDYFCLHLVTVGKGVVRTAGGNWPVQAGDAFCLWPGQFIEYAQVPGEAWEFCWVQVTGVGTEAFVRACGFAPERLVLHPPDSPRAVQSIELLHAYYQHPAEARECYHALALLFALAAAFCVPLSPPDPTSHLARVAQAVHAASQSLLHTGVNATELARHCGVSRATLLRACRLHLGCSPHGYLQQARLQAAQELLAQTDLPLAAVAAATGFATRTYFLQCFRRAVGLTPGAWRQQARLRTAGG